VILLLDLDDTLVERTAAFTVWARRFVDGLGGGGEDVAFVVAADGDGRTPRAEVARRLLARFALTLTEEQMVDVLLHDHVADVRAATGVVARLEQLGEAGVTRVLVSNGVGSQQRAKLEATGLGAVLDHVVVSGEVGLAKPDPAVYRHALALAGGAAEDAWMVGDHPEADVRGPGRLGLRTGWVHGGRRWTGDGAPTVAAATAAEVLDLVRREAAGA